jgi:dolichol kinase
MIHLHKTVEEPHIPDAGGHGLTRPFATKKSLQLGRRAFHMFNGVLAASAYALFFTHTQAVYLLGTVACLVYLFEQVRIKYPELMRRAPGLERIFLRAEEQAKESAMIPYAIAILLTIITFPKQVALIAIYTLALADPMSAIVGIKLGRRHVVADKSVEGSLAFFATTLLVVALVLAYGTAATLWPILGATVCIAILSAILEMLPIRLDDNLTIPIFVGFVTWTFVALFRIPLH